MKDISEFIGIDSARFKVKIEPFLTELLSKGGKVDLALLKIEQQPGLALNEKMYCAYIVGTTVGGKRR